MAWTNETRIKNTQVNSNDWIDLRAQNVTWNQECGINVPTTPSKSGIPAHEGDWLGVSNPQISIKGLINYGNDIGSVINIPKIQQLITATGPSFFIEAKFTSGNDPYHVGSIGVFIQSFQISHEASAPYAYPYSLVLIATSGV